MEGHRWAGHEIEETSENYIWMTLEFNLTRSRRPNPLCSKVSRRVEFKAESRDHTNREQIQAD